VIKSATSNARLFLAAPNLTQKWQQQQYHTSNVKYITRDPKAISFESWCVVLLLVVFFRRREARAKRTIVYFGGRAAARE
jgi:hypothetical protein